MRGVKSETDRGIIYTAFNEMLSMVNYMTTMDFEAGPRIFDNYFGPYFDENGDPHGDEAIKKEVRSIYETVLDFANTDRAPSYVFNPKNLDQIDITLDFDNTDKGCPPFRLGYAADTQNFGASGARRIIICQFGWLAVYKRKLSDVTCDKVGPEVGDHMFTIAALLFHEIL